MPFLIQHIDAIAREKMRDVLYIGFDPFAFEQPLVNPMNWLKWDVRNTLIAWLDEQCIAYSLCMGMSAPDCDGFYSGGLYIDVEHNTGHPQYQKLCSHLEDEHGNSHIRGVIFYLLPLRIAQQNVFADAYAHEFDAGEFEMLERQPHD